MAAGSNDRHFVLSASICRPSYFFGRKNANEGGPRGEVNDPSARS